VTERLAALGGTIYEGHSAENVKGADVVVISSAVRPDNPEVAIAVNRQIPVIPRAEMLAELMRLKYGIAIAGAHGKTSTTSMVGTVLNTAGMDPTIVVGGRVAALGSNAKLGRGEFMVVEADESDGSFLNLSPTIAVVTNIDREHLDYYKDIDEICQHFVNFVNKVPFYGSIIMCLDDPFVQSVIPQVKRQLITYGLSAQADITAANIRLSDSFGSEFNVRDRGKNLGRIKLQVPGQHNILNSLAAIAVGLDLKIDFEKIAVALGDFRGVDRRFQIKGEKNDIIIVDDYGHHPSEIKATLAAAKTSNRRLVVLFQPHRYSRTKHLYDEFSRAFYEVDVLRLVDIYAASEEPIEGVNSQSLAATIERFGHRDVKHVGSVADAARALQEVVEPGDLVLTLGAGNVWQAGEELLRIL
jgi:UDP-N-acetylmuramate--alanine ligase